MTASRALAHLCILAYLSVLLFACVYSLTGTAYVWPQNILSYAKLMLRGYESDSDSNVDIVAEGLNRNGQWQKIDLNAYYPESYGEASTRRLLPGVRTWKGEEKMKDAQMQLARQILKLEIKNQRPYTTVRLYEESWPKSPVSVDALHMPEHTTRTFLTQAP